MGHLVSGGIRFALTGIGAFLLLWSLIIVAESSHSFNEAVLEDDGEAAQEAYDDVDGLAPALFWIGLGGVVLMAGSHLVPPGRSG